MSSLNETGTGESSTRVVPATPSAPVTSSYEDLGPQLNVLVWLLTSLAAGWLALRIYCKFIRHRGLWWDDWFLIASWMALVFGSTSNSVAVVFDLGKPVANIEPANVARMFMFSNLAGAWLIMAALWSKTSFAFTMLRIANRRWVKGTVWFIIVSMNVSMSPTALLTLIHCWPIEKTWDFRLAGSCLPPYFIIYLCSFTSGSMDIVLALLPWKIVWELDMSIKERLGAILAMSLGIFAGMTSFFKIYLIQALVQGNASNAIQLAVLSTVEAAITIMAACIPILRALARDKRQALEGVTATGETATSRASWWDLSRSSTFLESSSPGSSDDDNITLRSVSSDGNSRRNSGRPLSIIGPSRSRKTNAKKTPILSQIVEADEATLTESQVPGKSEGGGNASLV